MIGLGLEMRSIDAITHQRVADIGEMYPNLMGASGVELAGEERGHRFSVPPVEGLQYLPVGDRFAPALAYGHLFACVRVPVYRCVHRAVGAVRQAPDKGQVAASHRAGASVIRKLRGQRLVRPVVLGGYHEAGGVLVESMYDAGAADAADAGQAVAAMRDQRVDERPGLVAGAGMNDQTLGLVDDDDVVVLVDDIERDGLARGSAAIVSGTSIVIVSPAAT